MIRRFPTGGDPVAFVVFIALLVMLCQVARSATQRDASREKRINDGWSYLEFADSSLDRVMSRTDGWAEVNIPHSWNAFDAVDPIPGYRRSAGWYRRQLSLPANLGNRHVLLYFEGVNIKCRIFVNREEAGKHTGGYLGFTVDVTPHLKTAGDNWIYVWVDNSYDPDVIPSQKSDFFIYGGITRDVWVKILSPQYVERVHVRTLNVKKQSAETELHIRIMNTDERTISARLEASLTDALGRDVARRDTSVVLKSGVNSVSLRLPKVKNPALWSPDSPMLYTASVRVNPGTTPGDVEQVTYGYRWFEFKEHGAFYINGERLLLRGTHRHEDYAGMANAIPDSLHRKDMEMIKGMGANFVRLAHYPQDPEVYRACDELGLLVWDELPWCRGGVGGAFWKTNVRRLLEEQLIQNHNHPSIILWSLGNEINYDVDFPGGDNIDSLRAFFTELRAIAKRHDPDRPVSVRKFYEVADLVDVFSPSIWMGWYSGQFDGYEKAITDAHLRYPRLMHVEYGGDSHVGRHTENPLGGDGLTTPDGWEKKFEATRLSKVALQGDWSESYIVNLFDWHLHVSEQLDWFAGNAQWAFKDFATPLRPENPIPYVNQKGLVDRSGVPKDAYYVFKSYWSAWPKFCYLLSHTWTERNGPKGLKRPIRVYSNCDQVELFVNGISSGLRRRNIKNFPAAGLTWNVEFVEGANNIRAVGFDNTKPVADDSMSVVYSFVQPGEAAELHLEVERVDGIRYMLKATAVDNAGRHAVGYNKRVYFTTEGEGKLLGDFGTPTRSRIIEMANGSAQIEFESVPAGRAVIEARTHDLKGSFVIIPNQGGK